MEQGDEDQRHLQVAPRSGERWLLLGVTVVALAVATVVRVAFLAKKPFWRDEAWVAWLVEAPPAALADLPYAVPIGFLQAVRALAAVLPGAPEVAYRLLPLCASLGAVALVPVLARRLGAPPRVAAAALWLAAGLPALVYYARELKPYALDMFFAVLVSVLVAGLVQVRAGQARSWLLLLFALAVAPWLTFGAVFALAAALAWATAQAARLHGARALVRWAAPSAVLAAAQAAAYVVALRRQVTSPILHEIWRGEVLSAAAGPRMTLYALWEVHHASLSYLFPTVWPVALLLAIVGAVSWQGQARSLLLSLWLGGALLVSMTALAGLYLVTQGRLLLFLAPPVVFLVAAGLVRVGGLVGVAVAVAAGLWWSTEAVAHRLRPVHSEPDRYFLYDVVHDVEPLIARLAQAGVAGRAVMVSRHAAFPFRYYRRGRLAEAHVSGVLARDFGAELDRWLPGLPAGGWLLLLDEEAERGRRRELLERGYVVKEIASARGARLWRLTPSSPPRT